MARLSGARYLLIYDADCGFCRWSLEQVLRCDRRGRLEPLALQDPRARELLAGMDQERMMDSWHLISPARERWSDGAAAPALLRLLPGGSLPARVLEAAPRTTERAYAFVARHRGSLGRRLHSSRRV